MRGATAFCNYIFPWYIKVKPSLCTPSKACTGSRHILNLATRQMYVISLMPRPSHSQRNNPGYPLNSMQSHPQDQSGCFWDKKNLLALPGIKPWIIQSTVQSLWQTEYKCIIHPCRMQLHLHWKSEDHCFYAINAKTVTSDKYSSLRRAFFDVCFSCQVRSNAHHNVCWL
jgi:hypothetical protein